MTAALLDINVLLALLDPLHIDHERGHDWYAGWDGLWASCPITQNGFVRIASQSKYTNPVSASEAVTLLRRFTESHSHRFWPDDRSILDPALFDNMGMASRRVTDTYLVGLAAAHEGRLVTFDQKLSASAVRGGEDHLMILP